MAQGLVNGVLNKTLTHSCLQFEWFSMFLLECVYLSLHYPLFAFDIWYVFRDVCVCVRVCVRECVNVCLKNFFVCLAVWFEIYW